MADETLRELAVSIRRVPASVEDDVRAVIQKGSLNIKNQMISEARGHRHFPRLAGSITYETHILPGVIEGEIGPDKGVLAGIAYFGSSRPGGGTVPDPKGALDAEAPNVERFIGDAAARRLGGGP